MYNYLFLCNQCKLYGTGQSKDIRKYSYHCFRCNRKEKVILKGRGVAVRYKGPYAPREAVLICREVNKEIVHKKEN
ncbi:hypothetical protein CL619_03150 [archaeon]|nr:hypothetical protein [archaeon]